jgi:hypothetical protein
MIFKKSPKYLARNGWFLHKIMLVFAKNIITLVFGILNISNRIWEKNKQIRFQSCLWMQCNVYLCTLMTFKHHLLHSPFFGYLIELFFNMEQIAGSLYREWPRN